MEHCNLCCERKELQKSHIVPRAHIKSLKGSGSQVHMLRINDAVTGKLANYNPTEKLLCRDCEQFISIHYERYGTRLLKNPKNVKKKPDSLVFKSFKYQTFYLYLLSILWRASISTLPEFAKVDLGSKWNELIRKCIVSKTRKVGPVAKVDHYFRISVIKLVDKEIHLESHHLRQIHINFQVEKPESELEPMVYYFVVDGYLIIYHLMAYGDIHLQRTNIIGAQLTDHFQVIVPKVDYREFDFFVKAVDGLSRYCAQK